MPHPSVLYDIYSHSVHGGFYDTIQYNALEYSAIWCIVDEVYIAYRVVWNVYQFLLDSWECDQGTSVFVALEILSGIVARYCILCTTRILWKAAKNPGGDAK